MPKGRNVPAQTLQRLLLKLEVSLEGEAGCKKSPLTTPPPPPRGFIHSKRTQWGRDLLMWSYRVGYDGGGRGRTHRCRNVCPPSSLQHLGEFSFAWEAGAPSFAWQSARCVGYWLCQRPSRVTLAAASAEPRRRRVPTQRNAHVPTLPKLRLTSKFRPTKLWRHRLWRVEVRTTVSQLKVIIDIVENWRRWMERGIVDDQRSMARGVAVVKKCDGKGWMDAACEMSPILPGRRLHTK